MNSQKDHDLAISIACKKFDEIYPKELQPEWLKYCMFMNVEKNENRNWVIKFKLKHKPQINANQYWMWHDDGTPVLFEVDPTTTEKRIVISGGNEIEFTTFFETEINLLKNETIILVNVDPNKLDGSVFEVNRR